MSLQALSLRLRLTLAFAGATAVLLSGAAGLVFLQVKHGLDGSLDAALRERAGALAELARRSDDTGLRRALAVEGQPAQLLDARGAVVAASPGAGARPLVAGLRRRRAAAGVEVAFERHEAARLLARPAGRGAVLVVSMSMAQREQALENLGGALVLGVPLLVLIASGAGYLVAAGALRPVDRMRRRASEISAATSDVRLPLPPARDELHRLGETLNAMLARLADSARQERSFLANASHELRTPLAILKAEVDIALRTGAGVEDLRAALRSIGEEADRLSRLAEDLLVIARGEDGDLPLSREPVDLGAVAADVVRRFAPVAAGRVESDVPAGLVVDADRLRLEQALGNLVDNALRHGAPPVVLHARRTADAVELHVTDAGGGFASGRVGEAVGPAGGGNAGGFGLGLPIVSSIARAHGGSAHAQRTDGGADVWFSVPAGARASTVSA